MRQWSSDNITAATLTGNLITDDLGLSDVERQAQPAICRLIVEVFYLKAYEYIVRIEHWVCRKREKILTHETRTHKTAPPGLPTPSNIISDLKETTNTFFTGSTNDTGRPGTLCTQHPRTFQAVCD